MLILQMVLIVVKVTGKFDWLISQIVQEDLRKRESLLQHELDTFQPNGLNEREVALL